MIDNQIIIGIDPGTNLLGYGLIRITNNKAEYLNMGILDMRKEKDAYAKLNKIFIEISRICEKYNPDIMAIESPFMDKNAQVILKLGRAQAAAILAASNRGIPIYEYAPRKAKIAICGNGAASKEQVCNILSKTLNIDSTPTFLDASDALAIAMCHFYQSNSILSTNKSTSNWKDFIKNNPDRIKKR